MTCDMVNGMIFHFSPRANGIYIALEFIIIIFYIFFIKFSGGYSQSLVGKFQQIVNIRTIIWSTKDGMSTVLYYQH